MKRATTKKVLLKKDKTKIHRRRISPATRSVGPSSAYEEIRRRGGHARVCIIRSVGGIGDVLMTTPTLIQLKREFPDIKLTYAIDMHRAGNTYNELVKNAPFVDEIIDARFVKHGNYDVVMDISAVCIRYERKGLPAINRIDLFAKACGITRLRRKLPFYQVEPEEQKAVRYRLHNWKKNGKQFVVLHSASFDKKRSWTPGHYLDLIKYAEQQNPEIHFLVMDFNRVLGDISRYSNCLDVSDASIREKAAYIHEADLFIGPDSGLMHIAGAVGTQSIVIFGSVPPEARINHYPTHKPVRLESLSCLGCWYEACPIQTKCMTDLKFSVVYNRMLLTLGIERR